MTNASKHEFLFTPGSWLGEGTVSFSQSPEKIKFYTKWTVEKVKDGVIHCRQKVEMDGVTETVKNDFYIDTIKDEMFHITLKNETIEQVFGKGIIEQEKIAWEFRGHETFEGFEVYKLIDDGTYNLHAEYSSPDLFRTIIEGSIWKKMDN